MSYSIPLFDLNFDEREEQAVIETMRGKWISTGPRSDSFERAFAQALGVKHAVALANCTSALHLALQILNIGPGDEVIVPSLTFVATVNAIRYVGATPVFADIVGPEELTIDPAAIEAFAGPRTRAVIVMHYGGFPCRMDEIASLAHAAGLYVIEDACHGPLSEYHGKKLGTLGDVGCFSFYSNKNISTGEGGMIVTAADDYAAQLRLLRSHGMTSLSHARATGQSTAYDVVDLGYNYRLDDMRAAIGEVQLEKLPGDLQKRARLREIYLSRLAEIDELYIPFRNHCDLASNYIFPVVVKEGLPERREAIRRDLAEQGIQTSVHYPAVHRFSIYQRFRRSLPWTEYVADHEITLPMYGRLQEEQVVFICQMLKQSLMKTR
jgi:dTDP-4-amino-4,6-dideoxygalactose transaminase